MTTRIAYGEPSNMETAMYKEFLEKLLLLPEYERKQLAMFLIASTLTKLSKKNVVDFINELEDMSNET
tara:strand:- start:1212 stop:1415 length:204 start_codon:yes stop_codon:yes gene_type:complete